MVQQINRTQTNLKITSAEQDTGKKWIDGRVIYSKVFTGTLNIASASNATFLTHGISGLTTSFGMINITGFMKLSNTVTGTRSFLLPVFHESTSVDFSVQYMDGTDIIYSSRYAWGNSYYEMIIEYVK